VDERPGRIARRTRMRRINRMRPRREVILLFLATADCYSSAHILEWTSQVLPSPFGGRHTGVATHDLNGDGYQDLLFSAGRHGVDQSFALINLGFQKNDGTFRFSDPIRIGNPGGFYQIDASALSSLEDNHVALRSPRSGTAQFLFSVPSTVLLEMLYTLNQRAWTTSPEVRGIRLLQACQTTTHRMCREAILRGLTVIYGHRTVNLSQGQWAKYLKAPGSH
jgi:hypothetical protein